MFPSFSVKDHFDETARYPVVPSRFRYVPVSGTRVITSNFSDLTFIQFCIFCFGSNWNSKATALNFIAHVFKLCAKPKVIWIYTPWIVTGVQNKLIARFNIIVKHIGKPVRCPYSRPAFDPRGGANTAISGGLNKALPLPAMVRLLNVNLAPKFLFGHFEQLRKAVASFEQSRSRSALMALSNAQTAKIASAA